MNKFKIIIRNFNKEPSLHVFFLSLWLFIIIIFNNPIGFNLKQVLSLALMNIDGLLRVMVFSIFLSLTAYLLKNQFRVVSQFVLAISFMALFYPIFFTLHGFNLVGLGVWSVGVPFSMMLMIVSVSAYISVRIIPIKNK